jgi:hypothetical protein
VVKTIEIPKSNGWYEDIDTETGIPKGKICSEKNPSARFWGRAKEKDAYCQFIGAVVHRYDLKRGVEARYYPTFVFGMALLKPAGPGTEEVVVQAPPDYTLLLRRIATAKTHIKNMRSYTKPRIIKTFEELIREVEELIRQD